MLVTEKSEDFPMNQFYQEHSTRTVKHANKRIVRNIATHSMEFRHSGIFNHAVENSIRVFQRKTSSDLITNELNYFFHFFFFSVILKFQ